MRYLTPHLIQDLQKKMVFLAGPRQVGKTTLARTILDKHFPSGRYFNWDFDEDRQLILKKRWKTDSSLLVFDEFHKFPRWKTWLKGVYDTYQKNHSILVTGSARLDVYKRGGDSLMGRYYYWRLHPFTLDEIPQKMTPEEAFHRLMNVGGFPEPFLDGDEREARRWRRHRFDRILREDIRDLENIRNIQLLDLFVEILRTRVGSIIVISNIANELQIAPKTAKMWLELLERMYLVFVVRPFTRNLPRAIQKPPKVYFFDNADVKGDRGAVFENLVASSLLKRLHFLEDRDGYRYELRYIRDKEGREVDFVLVKEGVPVELIEVKYSDDNISRPLVYYAEKLQPIRATQIVATLKNSYDQNRFRILSPLEYFRGL